MLSLARDEGKVIKNGVWLCIGCTRYKVTTKKYYYRQRKLNFVQILREETNEGITGLKVVDHT